MHERLLQTTHAHAVGNFATGQALAKKGAETESTLTIPTKDPIKINDMKPEHPNTEHFKSSQWLGFRV